MWDVTPFTPSRQILTGRPLFPNVNGMAAADLMVNGSRPSRPDHSEVSDPLWRMIKGCCHKVVSRRMSIGEVVTLLDAELNRTPASRS